MAVDYEQDELEKQLKPSTDPFGGSGIKLPNGDWVPKDHPLAQQPGTPTQVQAPGLLPEPTPQTGDPFGGTGVKLANGDWVPADHPLAQQAGATPSQPGAAPAGGQTPATGSNGAPFDVPQQAVGAQTNSTTPGAAPDAATANQGAQDVVLNSWLNQATQGTQIDTNDPNFRQQADTYAAAQERARRNATADAAEGFSAEGMGGSGAQTVENRMLNERAAQNSAGFESSLIASELENRRDEIKTALQQLGGLITGDQQRELTKQLADLEAAIKREGIKSSEGLGYAELDLKDKLGMGALNGDLIQALLGHNQFNTGQALDWSKFDWDSSPLNPKNY